MVDIALNSQTPFVLTIPNATINEAGEVICDLTSFAGGAGLFTTLDATGAVSFDTTLAVAGASTLAAVSCTTLAASGASTLAAVSCTTLSPSGLLAAAAAVTVGTTLGVTGASTLAGVGCTTLSTSGVVSMVLATYADNAAALLGGLVATNLYKTATGEVRIVV